MVLLAHDTPLHEHADLHLLILRVSLEIVDVVTLLLCALLACELCGDCASAHNSSRAKR